jgi:hypothetical protein
MLVIYDRTVAPRPLGACNSRKANLCVAVARRQGVIMNHKSGLLTVAIVTAAIAFATLVLNIVAVARME